ncbi:MAG: response regulator [Actinomycetota bacterium]|nr:response regulator [Actinomycetota bacterium]
MTVSTETVRRVLLAEDNEDHRFLTMRALRDHDSDNRVEIDAVMDGEEALDYVYRRGRYAGRPRPHLILLDLRMPRMDGFEVLRQLKSDADLHTIPIVVLTSSARPDDVDTAYQLGTNSYVTKPVTIAGMRERLTNLTEHWMVQASLPQPPE